MLAAFDFLMLACEPRVDDPTWMVGQYYTGAGAGNPARSVERLEIEDDGTLRFITFGQCENEPSSEFEYDWEAIGEQTIRVFDANGANVQALDEIRISPGDECNEIELDEIIDGAVFTTRSMWRGSVCLQKIPSCGEAVQCDDCVTVWCDDPPPPCD